MLVNPLQKPQAVAGRGPLTNREGIPDVPVSYPRPAQEGVNPGGFREILGLDLVTSEDGAGWLAFVRSLVARGL